jgi:hypothetical protein
MNRLIAIGEVHLDVSVIVAPGEPFEAASQRQEAYMIANGIAHLEDATETPEVKSAEAAMQKNIAAGKSKARGKKSDIDLD